MRANGFLWRILGRDADEDETRTYSAEENGTSRSRRSRRRREPEEGQQPWGFTVKRAAEIIADLPSDVPQESAPAKKPTARGLNGSY